MTHFYGCVVAVSALAISSCSTVDSTSIPAETTSPTFTAATAPDSGASQTTDGTTTYTPGTATEGASASRTIELTSDTNDQVRRFDPSGPQSRRGVFGRQVQAARPGIAYFLPRQLAKVTAKRSKIDLDKAIKGLGEAELALAAAKAQVTANKAAIKQTEDALVANGEVPAVRDLLAARLVDQKAGLTKAQAAVTIKEKEHAAAKQSVSTAAQSGSGGGKLEHNVTLNIELLAPTADPAHGYRLSPRHNIFRDDESKLSISPGGLLTSLDIVATDRTADALVELATFAGAISRLGGARSIRSGKGEEPCHNVPDELIAIVDFADTDSVADLNGTLSCMGVRVKTVGGKSYGSPLTDAKTATTVEGIVYRTPVDVVVRIERCLHPDAKCKETEGWFPTQALALSLPQAGPISHVTQRAGFMTRTTYGLAFKDGILTSYNSNRPSEVLEVARTPMRLVNGVFDGASKIISLRTGQNNLLAGQANSQVALLQAQNKILAEALAGKKNLTDAELAALQSAMVLQSAEAKQEAIRLCVLDKTARGEPATPCFAEQ